MPQIGQTGAHATTDRHAFGSKGGIVCELRSDVILGISGEISLVDAFDGLFRTKGDEDTKHDDANFAYESAPTVQRFGQMEVHSLAPQHCEPNIVQTSAMGEVRSLIWPPR